jgi:phospholipid/cholesterol/gamma-HCH transport system ATP-binding protein
MIEFKNISKSFGGKQIVYDMSGSFYPSDNSLIIGASGTGKSVLLKCLVGLLKPDTGHVLFDGRDLVGSDTKTIKEIRREIGMLFQGSALFDSKTVLENVKFPLDMMTSQTEAEKIERVHFCLKRVGLEQTSAKMPSELSGGMQKRVGIARAIVLNPKYLFCDEPNSGLDPQTSIKIDLLIQDITDEFKITTVVVTHDMNSVMGIGERVMFIHEGRKKWEGDNNTILTATEPALVDFVFASKMMMALREKALGEQV